MAIKTAQILHKRGLDASLPELSQSELAYTMDKEKLYVGTASGNAEVAKHYYGVSTTAGATPEKIVSLTGFNFVEGARIQVKFTNENTAATPTLNINYTGGVPIIKAGGAAFKGIKKGVYTFVYDGANFTLQGEGGDSLAAKTYTPGTTNQVIPAGSYLDGAQTIKGDANLVAENIKYGVSIFGVSGKLADGSVAGDIPGSSTVVSTAKSGDSSGSTVNYYGKATGLVTGTYLSALTGVTSGTLTTSGDITWLKFKHKGRILLVADRHIRTNISWDQIQAQNCVTGKRITINGVDYLCRLMTGSDHYNYNTDNGGNTASIAGGGNEWDDLIVGLTPDNAVSNWSSSWTWCQEVHSGALAYRVFRGYGSAANLSYSGSGGAISNVGWRPVLEVL